MKFIKGFAFAILYLIGYISHCFSKASHYYMTRRITKLMGEGRIIQYPYHISGLSNLTCGESCNIGKGSVIMCTRSKVIIKGHFVSGPNLTVIAGNHMSTIGRYLDDIDESKKNKLDEDHFYDEDIIIEKDVWAGANVTILKGVTIERGAIIAAGAVVTKSMPPYSIIAGVPAKPIKMRWSVDEILQHENRLYPLDERLDRETLLLLSQQLKH